MGKLMIATAMTKAGGIGMALIAVLLVNTMLSLYFYVRPIYFMYLRPDTENRPAIPAGAAVAALLGLCAVALFATGLNGGMSERSRQYGRLVHSPNLVIPSTAGSTLPASESEAKLVDAGRDAGASAAQ